ncbi:glutamate--tRNA ligase family protein [Compostibacter hankyongensis]|uniref:tRNA glutamyl-Q(34) synthetase GluQRS n=1 Tax=Compostibacter hankyongensis TaxID=1007089 RepID=A0ABP8G684_9BACT
MKQLTFRKTRIAPTPSGYLHLGNVLSFAFTAAWAQQTGARVLLRIDDLDQPRIRREYVQDIFDTLHFLKISWDEGPRDYRQYEKDYTQLRRMDLYRTALQRLKEQGLIFACTCSRTEIAARRAQHRFADVCRDRRIPPEQEEVSWRLHTDPSAMLTVSTPQGTVTKTALPPAMTDFVVRKKDGFPAYQLTSVVDDDHFGVDLVVRGDDLWPSTLAQHYLSGLLPGNTFRRAACYHHPLLQDTRGRKLSKSAGDLSIRFLREAGKKPADICSLIALRLGHAEPVKNFSALLEIIAQQM